MLELLVGQAASLLRFLLLLASATLIFLGCTSATVSGTVPVSGRVTYNAKPVAGAIVTFVGDESARIAVATTDASGVYALTTLDTKGAMPGTYTVLVSKFESSSASDVPISMDEAAQNKGTAKEPKKLLPAKYADPAKSPLKFEVKKGQSHTFDLPLAD